MLKKLYPEESIAAIASSIRSKNGSQDTYNVGEMSGAVDALEIADLETLNVTQNGTYQPSQGKNGFSSVSVNVSSSPGRYSECTAYLLNNIPLLYLEGTEGVNS